MSLGKTIAKIRKDKNIPVKYLIHNCMNRSNYTRFVEGKIEISVNKFLILIKRLNLSLSEFEYINNGYNDCIEQSKLKLQHAINYSLATGDFTNSYELKHQSLKKCKENNRLVHNYYYYFYCLINLCIEYTQLKPLKNKYTTPIKNYLLSIDTWTYYELSLFNNSCFALNPRLVDILLKRVIKNLYKYKNYPNNKNEIIRILINIISLCIYKKEPNKASYYYKIAKKIKIFDSQIFEKTFLKYYCGLLLVIKGKHKGFMYTKKSLSYLKFVNDLDSYYPLKNSLNKILERYHIKNSYK